MQVILNIDGTQMGDTVIDLFKNLSDAKKEELALELMKSWLKEPHETEHQVYEAALMTRFRQTNNNNSYKDYKSMSDEKMRMDYDFNESMKKFKSSREVMVEMITEAAKASFQKHVNEWVEKDEQLAKVRDALIQALGDSYPAIVLEALTKSISDCFSAFIQVTMQTNQKTPYFQTMLQDVAQRLQR